MLINKCSFLIFCVFGSYFRTLAVILVSDFFLKQQNVNILWGGCMCEIKDTLGDLIATHVERVELVLFHVVRRTGSCV